MLRRLAVNVQEVADAMSGSSDDPFRYYLNQEDGAVVAIPGEALEGVSGVDDEPEVDVDADEYVRIPHAETREQYGDMARFAETVSDRDIRERLDVALTGRGAFARFRDVVWPDRALYDDWHAFKRQAERARAISWLESVGIEAVDTSPRQPAPAPAPAPRALAVDLIDLLLLGAPGGNAELSEGQVHRVLPVRTAAEGRTLFRGLARDICAVCDTPWRKRFVEGKTSFDLDRFHLELLDDRIELAIDVPRDVWRRFAKAQVPGAG